MSTKIKITAERDQWNVGAPYWEPSVTAGEFEIEIKVVYEDREDSGHIANLLTEAYREVLEDVEALRLSV